MDSLEREARERKKKAMALATLPLSVGFFAWRLQANTNAAPPPPRPPDPIVKKAAPEVQRAAGPVLQLEKQRVVVVPVGLKDPFAPAFTTAPKASPGKVVNPGLPKPGPKVMLAELGPTNRMPLPTLRPFEAGTPLPPLREFPMAPAPRAPITPSVNPPAMPGPAEPARPAMPYVLTGIVKGSPDVAILRHWDGSRRIARVGDALDKTYRLTLIEESFVVVSGGGEANSLRLGGDVRPESRGAEPRTNGSRTMAAPEDEQ